MMLSIYEWLFGKDTTLTESKIEEDCSGLQDPDLPQAFCRETIGFPISNPQWEEAKVKDDKKKERMKLRLNLQSPKPVKPFRLVNGARPGLQSLRSANVSYKDVLMR